MVRVQSISRRPQFNNFSRDTVPLTQFHMNPVFLGLDVISVFLAKIIYSPPENTVLKNRGLYLRWGLSEKTTLEKKV